MWKYNANKPFPPQLAFWSTLIIAAATELITKKLPMWSGFEFVSILLPLPPKRWDDRLHSHAQSTHISFLFRLSFNKVSFHVAQNSQVSRVSFCHTDFSQRLWHYQLSESLPERLSKPSPVHLFYTNAKYLDKLSPQILQAKMGVTGRAGPTVGGG